MSLDFQEQCRLNGTHQRSRKHRQQRRRRRCWQRWQRRRHAAFVWLSEERTCDFQAHGVVVGLLVRVRQLSCGLLQGSVYGKACGRVLHGVHVALQNLRNHGDGLHRSCSRQWAVSAAVDNKRRLSLLPRTAALSMDVQQHVRHAVVRVGVDAAAIERQVALGGYLHCMNGCALDADDQPNQAVWDLLRVVHHLHVGCGGNPG